MTPPLRLRDTKRVMCCYIMCIITRIILLHTAPAGRLSPRSFARGYAKRPAVKQSSPGAVTVLTMTTVRRSDCFDNDSCASVTTPRTCPPHPRRFCFSVVSCRVVSCHFFSFAVKAVEPPSALVPRVQVVHLVAPEAATLVGGGRGGCRLSRGGAGGGRTSRSIPVVPAGAHHGAHRSMRQRRPRAEGEPLGHHRAQRPHHAPRLLRRRWSAVLRVRGGTGLGLGGSQRRRLIRLYIPPATINNQTKTKRA